MIDGIKVFVRGLNAVRQQGYVYIWANVAFIALSLPIVTLPAAFSALMHVGYMSQTTPHEADLSLFWETFKANLWRALPWGMVNFLFGLIVISNFIRDSGTDNSTTQLWQIVRSGVLFLWISSLLYTWPLYYEMQTPTWLGAQRNSLVMIVHNPFFTLTLIGAFLLIAVVSTVMLLPWMLLTWGVFSALGSAAVLNRLQLYRERA